MPYHPKKYNDSPKDWKKAEKRRLHETERFNQWLKENSPSEEMLKSIPGFNPKNYNPEDAYTSLGPTGREDEYQDLWSILSPDKRSVIWFNNKGDIIDYDTGDVVSTYEERKSQKKQLSKPERISTVKQLSKGPIREPEPEKGLPKNTGNTFGSSVFGRSTPTYESSPFSTSFGFPIGQSLNVSEAPIEEKKVVSPVRENIPLNPVKKQKLGLSNSLNEYNINPEIYELKEERPKEEKQISEKSNLPEEIKSEPSKYAFNPETLKQMKEERAKRKEKRKGIKIKGPTEEQIEQSIPEFENFAMSNFSDGPLINAVNGKMVKVLDDYKRGVDNDGNLYDLKTGNVLSTYKDRVYANIPEQNRIKEEQKERKFQEGIQKIHNRDIYQYMEHKGMNPGIPLQDIPSLPEFKRFPVDVKENFYDKWNEFKQGFPEQTVSKFNVPEWNPTMQPAVDVPRMQHYLDWTEPHPSGYGFPDMSNLARELRNKELDTDIDILDVPRLEIFPSFEPEIQENVHKYISNIPKHYDFEKFHPHYQNEVRESIKQMELQKEAENDPEFQEALRMSFPNVSNIQNIPPGTENKPVIGPNINYPENKSMPSPYQQAEFYQQMYPKFNALQEANQRAMSAIYPEINMLQQTTSNLGNVIPQYVRELSYAQGNQGTKYVPVRKRTPIHQRVLQHFNPKAFSGEEEDEKLWQ
jgi:hypothetical protein